MGNRVFLTLLVFAILLIGQTFTAQTFWIYFKDKPEAVEQLNKPELLLSERAVLRRVNQQIAFSVNDVPVHSAYISTVQTLNADVKYASRWLNAVAVDCSLETIEKIKSLPFVLRIENGKKLKKAGSDKFEAEMMPAGLIFDAPFRSDFGYALNQFKLHNFDFLAGLGFDGTGMHVAVIDAGFWQTDILDAFAHLFGNNRILSVRDFVDNDGSVYEDHYHGTAVLSCMAGYLQGEYVGSCPGASFHLLRTEDADNESLMEEYNWVRAAEYADSVGVDVINTSLGYTEFDDSAENHNHADLDGNTTVIALAADIAASKGILLVTSAGNSGSDPWRKIGTPADADSTLTVGAVDSAGNLAFFSSVGPSADGDVKPNVVSVGWNTYLIAAWDGTVVQSNGTSFSSPLMAGMATSLWQALRYKSAQEIKTIIEMSSHQFANPDSLMGYGIPDFKWAYEQFLSVINFSENEIEIFPNPAKSYFYLNSISGADKAMEVQLIDVGGKVVLAKKVLLGEGPTKVEFGNVDKGIYMLLVSDKNEIRRTQKVCID